MNRNDTLDGQQSIANTPAKIVMSKKRNPSTASPSCLAITSVFVAAIEIFPKHAGFLLGIGVDVASDGFWHLASIRTDYDSAISSASKPSSLSMFVSIGG